MAVGPVSGYHLKSPKYAPTFPQWKTVFLLDYVSYHRFPSKNILHQHLERITAKNSDLLAVIKEDGKV